DDARRARESGEVGDGPAQIGGCGGQEHGESAGPGTGGGGLAPHVLDGDRTLVQVVERDLLRQVRPGGPGAVPDGADHGASRLAGTEGVLAQRPDHVRPFGLPSAAPRPRGEDSPRRVSSISVMRSAISSVRPRSSIRCSPVSSRIRRTFRSSPARNCWICRFVWRTSSARTTAETRTVVNASARAAAQNPTRPEPTRATVPTRTTADNNRSNWTDRERGIRTTSPNRHRGRRAQVRIRLRMPRHLEDPTEPQADAAHFTENCLRRFATHSIFTTKGKSIGTARTLPYFLHEPGRTSDARTDHAAGGPSTPEPQDQGNAQGRSEYRGQPGPEAVRGGGSEVPHPVAQPSYEPVGQGHTDTQGAQDPGDQGRGRSSRRPPEDLAHALVPL